MLGHSQLKIELFFSVELACLIIICVRMSRGKSHVAMEIGPGKLTSYLHAYSHSQLSWRIANSGTFN